MALNKTKEYDFIIVGGGIAGLSCAYWIKKSKKNAKIAIVDQGEIRKYDLDKQLCNLTVGSLNYLYRIYKLHGIEKVVECFNDFEENLDLIDNELEILDRNSYVNLYDGGTINLMEDGDIKDIGIFQSFVHELLKYDLPIKEIKSDNWKFGVKYTHDGNYESRKFIDTIFNKLKSEVDIYEKHTCKMINKSLGYVSIQTAGGEEFSGKKLILANSNSLQKLLPELREEIGLVDSVLFKFNSDVNKLDLYNYANQNNDGYFVKLIDGYYYAKHGSLIEGQEKLEEEEASISFQNFSKVAFPGVKIDQSHKTTMAYTRAGIPVSGQSEKNPSLYYLGGFAGQSKLFAFKMAKDLIAKIKI